LKSPNTTRTKTFLITLQTLRSRATLTEGEVGVAVVEAIEVDSEEVVMMPLVEEGGTADEGAVMETTEEEEVIKTGEMPVKTHLLVHRATVEEVAVIVGVEEKTLVTKGSCIQIL